VKRSRRQTDRGATAVEYAILVSLIAAVIVLTVTSLGQATVDMFDALDWP
jgi:Flp pilus assembly pilin Flp